LHRDFLVISGTASNIIKETCRYMKLWCNYLVTRFADIPDKVLNLFARYIFHILEMDSLYITITMITKSVSFKNKF